MTTPGEQTTDEQNPLELLLDLSVYAPLGFALEFRRLVPELAEAGRKQVDFSRSLGRAALRTLSKAGAATTTGTDRSSRPASTPTTGSRPNPPAGSAGDDHGDARDGDEVPGYDDLNAKAAVALAAESSASTLAWMRRREHETKNRKTVLAAIERASVDGS